MNPDNQLLEKQMIYEEYSGKPIAPIIVILAMAVAVGYPVIYLTLNLIQWIRELTTKVN